MKKCIPITSFVILCLLVIFFVWFLPNKNNIEKQIEINNVSEVIEKNQTIDYQSKNVIDKPLVDVRNKNNPDIGKLSNTNSDCYKSDNEDEEEEEGEINYKYKDDPVFDVDEFSGLVNDDNVVARDDLFSRKNHDLFKDQLEKGGGNTADDIIIQFENTIDYSLGIDFPEEKRYKIRSAQREMLLKRSEVDELLGIKQITPELHKNESKRIFENYLEQVAGIISDEEFKALYKIEKKDIHNVYDEMIAPNYQ